MNKNIGIKFSILVFFFNFCFYCYNNCFKNSNLDSLSSVNVIVISLSVTIKILAGVYIVKIYVTKVLETLNRTNVLIIPSI